MRESQIGLHKRILESSPLRGKSQRGSFCALKYMGCYGIMNCLENVYNFFLARKQLCTLKSRNIGSGKSRFLWNLNHSIEHL